MLFRCRWTFEFYLLALCLCFCTANSGSAQVPPLVPFVPAQMVPVQRDTPADITQETLPDAAPVQVQKAPLDPIVVFNPAGKRLIHLPYGWHLERFDEFYQFLSKRQQNAALNFVLQEVNAAGRITADRAEVRFRIAWTAVAIRRSGTAPFSQPR